MKKVFLVLLTVAFGLGSLAFADTQDFTGAPNPLGPTHTYTLAGQPIIVTASTGNLFLKTLGGNENGLGLAGDPSGQDEIFVDAFIQIDVSALIKNGITSLDFQMGSTTNGEHWTVDACATSLVDCGSAVSAGSDQLTTHTISLVAGTPFLDFKADIGNVLIHNVSATPVPEPASMIMLGSGLVGLAGTIRRKIAKK